MLAVVCAAVHIADAELDVCDATLVVYPIK
jgi:hypothetical protein